MASPFPTDRPLKVVCLEGCHCAVPKFDFSHTYTEYDNTSAAQVLPRIRDADIVITTLVPITPAVALQCANLKLIAVMATGAGWVDKAYFAARGITVINSPGSNIPAVSEHALGLYFACRKRVVDMHARTLASDEWAKAGTLTKRFPRPPLSCAQEVVGIVGYGALGRAIEALCRGVGMGRVVVAERKGEPPREGRVSFDECVRTASVLVLCCPLDPGTVNTIDAAELAAMREDAVLINMARGGIVNEQALADALRKGTIEAAATDVLEVEPPDGTSPLIPKPGEEPVPNLTISPHISWFTARTIERLQELLKDGVETFVAGGLVNAVVDGRTKA